MLQINFLPVRQLKKREKAKNELFAFGLFLVTLIVLLGVFAWWYEASYLEGAREENVRLATEKRNLQPKLTMIDKLNKDKGELERKTKIIEQLKKESSLTVRVMDEVANRVDSNRLWLDSMSETGSNVDLKGIALDMESVAQFMDSLKGSPFVRDVILTESSQKLLAGRDLKSFTISCHVAPPGSENATVPKGAPQKTTKR
jgi:type IV pilus assembly protein PilN